MIGSIIGDIVGTPYEYSGNKDKNFRPFLPATTFTDDTMMTVAVADWLLHGNAKDKQTLPPFLRKWFRKYPDADYGGQFRVWCATESDHPYGSWGNGSAMRVGPVGAWAESLEDAIATAALSAEVTHNHPEGIKGAQAVAAAIFLARADLTKEEIAKYIRDEFKYEFDTPDKIRPNYSFEDSCQGTIPQALSCFFYGNSFKDCIRNAVSLGGDADTLACITGSIAEAYYGVPRILKWRVMRRLPENIRQVVKEFEMKHPLFI